MATSRSSSDGDWTAGAFVFSGRPDPTWRISNDVVAGLVAIWNSLVPSDDTVASTPALGYRGCFVVDPAGRRWTAYHELVTLSIDSGSEERRDDERRFERTVLASAPAGTLPASFVA
jgi:hypothetical protein